MKPQLTLRERRELTITGFIMTLFNIGIAVVVYYVFRDSFHAPLWGAWLATIVSYLIGGLSISLYRIERALGTKL